MLVLASGVRDPTIVFFNSVSLPDLNGRDGERHPEEVRPLQSFSHLFQFAQDELELVVIEEFAIALEIGIRFGVVA